MTIHSSPSVARNRDAIANTLLPMLKERSEILELASGTGEHAAHFARIRPDLKIQPTDQDDEAFSSLSFHCRGLQNVSPPKIFDVLESSDILYQKYDAILCFNMIHIAPINVAQALFACVKERLKSQGRLFTYGPYRMGDTPLAESNQKFETWLKSKSERFGIRSLDTLKAFAKESGLQHKQTIAMPANNHLLSFELSS